MTFYKDGICLIVSENNVPDLFKGIPDSSVMIHPAAMRMSQLTLRSPVIIRSRDSDALCFAWPHLEIGRNNVFFKNLSKYPFKRDESVQLVAYEEEICAADKVDLVVQCSVDVDSEFREFLHCKLNDLYICKGSKYKFSYLRAKCVIEVKSIDGNQKEHYSRSSNSSNKISLCESKCQDVSAVMMEISDLKLHDDFSNMTRDNDNYKNQSISAFESSLCKTTDQSNSVFFTPNSSFADCYRTSDKSSLTPDEKVVSSNERKLTEKYFVVTASTVFDVAICGDRSEKSDCVSSYCLSGREEQIAVLQEFFSNYFLNDGASFCHASLLVGPSGSGKSMTAIKVINELALPLLKISPSKIYLKYALHGKNELKSLFKEAQEKQPSIILLEKIDVLCEMFQNNKGGMISSLADLIDELKVTRSKVFVLATAKDPSRIDPVLKYPGRFDSEVKFTLPDPESRLQILSNEMKGKKHNLTDDQLQLLAESTQGFSYHNLHQICAEAEFEHSRKSFDAEITKYSEKNVDEDSVALRYEDLYNQMKLLKCRVTTNESLTVQKVRWSDIGGMQGVKEKLKLIVELPIKHPAIFKRFGIPTSHGVLLYGPPGCSKTMIAKALATESSLNFIPVKGPELFSKWVGESEKAVRDLFKRAKEAAPCILFFDEIDALVGERGSSEGSDAEKRVVTQLLTEIDGAEQLEGVIIIAATNRPDILDPAMLRPGRLDHHIYVPLPDIETRKQILELKLKSMPVSKDVDLEWLANETDGYSGAEIVAICHEAAMLVILEDVTCTTPMVAKHHLVKALSIVTPRTTKELIQFYENYSSWHK